MKLIGLATLGRDAELRFTQQGDPVASFSVAYNYGRKDNGGNQPTQWVDCSLWGKRAESLAEYLTKGKQFYIELSDVHIETYESRNGQGHKLVGRVAEIEFTRGSRDDSGAQNDYQAPQQRQQSSQVPQRNSYADASGRSMAAQRPLEDDYDSDVPF